MDEVQELEMKTIVTKTVTETQTLCDHCGKPIIYSEQACIVCGKCACHECFHDKLVEMRLYKFPRFWPPNNGLPHFDAYACKGCSNKITRLFDTLRKRTEKHNYQCNEWHNWYLKQIKLLNELKEKAEKRIEANGRS